MLDLRLDGDRAWPELKDLGDRLILAKLHGMARLAMGTSMGKSSIALRIDLPDGRTVIAETTLNLLRTAMRAIEAREDMESQQQRLGPD
jgi:hypothetical protein